MLVSVVDKDEKMKENIPGFNCDVLSLYCFSCEICMYIAHYFILPRLNPFDFSVDRQRWCFEHSVS